MKYEAPYGVSDPNASYINGNPSTGTMGSIPPAASIENPQREIVNLIIDSGGSPTDTDLHQLSKGVQSGALIYAVDFGIPNSYEINTVPALTAYLAGQQWNVLIQNANTGTATLNISELGPREIVSGSGQPLKGGEMPAGSVVGLVDNGTQLQLLGANFGAVLTGNRDYYVNGTTGDDTLNDGTAAVLVAGTAHGPFLTIQRGIQAALAWNMNGFTVTIHVADGVYGGIVCTALNGAGEILIVGNTTTPANCVIQVATGEAIMIQANGYYIEGFKVVTFGNGTSPHLGDGVRLFGAVASIAYMEFGACFNAHISVQATSTLVTTGAISGDPNAFLNVTGNATYHMTCLQNSLINLNHTKMNIGAATNISFWVAVTENSVIDDVYASLVGAANVTGQKYSAALNGVINTAGAGVNYFPGTVAGTVVTGGQYG